MGIMCSELMQLIVMGMELQWNVLKSNSAPFYLTWWFVALMILVVGGLSLYLAIQESIVLNSSEKYWKKKLELNMKLKTKKKTRGPK